MWFTWMMATKMWMESDPMADPFRMAEEQVASILHLPLPGHESALPQDKELVA